MNSVAAIDLFCGAGGLTHGLEQSGIPVLAGYDVDSYCEVPYSQNNSAQFIQKPIEETTSKEILDIFRNTEIKVMVGCAPCQPFSTYSRRYIKSGKHHQKWDLLNEFTRIVVDVMPEIVSMENVIYLKHNEVFQYFLLKLYKLGYFVSTYDVDCRAYGIPQSRKRLVVLASRLGIIQLIPPTHPPANYVTVRDAISMLEVLEAGSSSSRDRLHKCSKLSPLNLRRIQASIPGGTWKDWDASVLANCHEKKTGKNYTSVYGRMEWDRPSPTITTQCFGFGNGRFGHPEQDRAISLREAALLQTFPIDYEFVYDNQPVVFKHVGRLIGNAVPVRLGKIIGQTILEHVESL